MNPKVLTPSDRARLRISHAVERVGMWLQMAMIRANTRKLEECSCELRGILSAQGTVYLGAKSAEQQVLEALAQRTERPLHVDHQVLHLPVGLFEQATQGKGLAAPAVGLHKEPGLDECRQVQRDVVVQGDAFGRHCLHKRLWFWHATPLPQ